MMKQVFIIQIVLLTGFLSLSGQDSYEPLVDTTKQWTSTEFHFHPQRPNYQDTYARRFRGDTIINEQKYLFLEECRDDSLFESWKRTGYLLREDTIFQKVYLRTSLNESLLYDFDVDIGDEVYIESSRLIVENVKYESIAGKIRKVVYFQTCYNYPLKIIEGIGTLDDIIEPYFWCMVNIVANRKLLCFSKDGEILIQKEENCFIPKIYTSILQNNANHECQIFPNPAQEYIIVRLVNEIDRCYLQLRSLEGRTVLDKELDTGTIKINTGLFDEGVYIISIILDDRYIINRKLFINK